MTRTDVMASSRPRPEGAARIVARRGRFLRRPALIPAAVLALALVAPGAAMAAGTTTGYSQTPPPPTTTTTTTPPTTTPTTPAPTKTTTPTTETSPSKESSEPAKEPTTPASSTSPETAKAKAAQLPFTGFDLRWSIALGVLLIGAGVSIVAMQRRQRRHDQR